jgi:hypothetical protein
MASVGRGPPRPVSRHRWQCPAQHRLQQGNSRETLTSGLVRFPGVRLLLTANPETNVRKRTLLPQALGAVSVREVRFPNPPHTPWHRGNESRPDLSLGGNPCSAQAAPRRDAGSGGEEKERMAWRRRTHHPRPSPASGERGGRHPRSRKTGQLRPGYAGPKGVCDAVNTRNSVSRPAGASPARPKPSPAGRAAAVDSGRLRRVPGPPARGGSRAARGAYQSLAGPLQLLRGQWEPEEFGLPAASRPPGVVQVAAPAQPADATELGTLHGLAPRLSLASAPDHGANLELRVRDAPTEEPDGGNLLVRFW